MGEVKGSEELFLQEESVLAVLRAEAGLKEAVQGFDSQSAVARAVLEQL